MNQASTPSRLRDALADTPLIAILRGIEPEEVEGHARALLETGFRLIEVPLNSPRPMESIARLGELMPEDALFGAGTVTTVEQVEQLADLGAQLVISPHFDPQLVAATRDAGLLSIPGVATPSEAFAALRAGAHALKLFPASLGVLKALRAVLPSETLVIAVGGLSPETLPDYRAAGANAFGLGSALYREGRSEAELREHAQAFQDVLSK